MGLTENSCRVCLRTDEFVHLNDWYSPMQELDTTVSYVECFWRCTRLKVNVYPGGGDQCDRDELENIRFLCSKCCNDLRNAYRFLTKSEQSDRTLRGLYAKAAAAATATAAVNSEPMEQFSSSVCLEEHPLKEEVCNYCNVDEVALSNQRDALLLNKPEKQQLTITKKVKNTTRTRKDVKRLGINPTANKLVKNATRRKRLNGARSEKAPDASVKKVVKRSRNKVGDGDKQVSCEHCTKLMPARKLKRHISQCHGPKPKLLCYACPRIFNDPGSLYRHEAIHKERERKHKCELCEQTFFNQLDCQRHMKTHDTNRKPEFKCDQCDKSFLHKGSLKSHQLFHTGPLFQCQLCPKRYVRAQDLQIHLRSHSGEMPYKCTKCDKAFALVHSLNVHLRKHDGVRYKCDVCGKEYTNGSTLSGHRKEHTGMPRKCSMCNKGFTTRSKTLRHIQHVHKISDPAEMEKVLVEVKLERVCRKPRLISLTVAEN